MGILFAMMFQFVFWVIIVTIIVRVVKMLKKTNSSGTKKSPLKNVESKDLPQCLNEDLHDDNYHTFCDYCGATIGRDDKKCKSCGARIKK